jgi:hypothetical protein
MSAPSKTSVGKPLIAAGLKHAEETDDGFLFFIALCWFAKKKIS